MNKNRLVSKKSISIIDTDEFEFKNRIDFLEDIIFKKMPEVFNLLLIDRSTNKNIIWANNNYVKHGIKQFSATSQIKTHLITGIYKNLIMPRSLKNPTLQKERTRNNAEIFTPLWIVKLQNHKIDESMNELSDEEYIKKKWLEISCGEGPYLTTRYDAETGEYIKLENRYGFVDLKLKRTNSLNYSKKKWFEYVKWSYKSSYGFEWNGDSLLLARENLLLTFRDFYVQKWKEEPLINEFKEIAEIISYNLFQMDGIPRFCNNVLSKKYYITPLSDNDNITFEEQLKFEFEEQLGLSIDKKENITKKHGIPVKIMDWELNRFEYFG